MTDDRTASAQRSPAARWAEAHRAELVGATREDAIDAVEQAGLRVKVEEQAGWTTQEFGIGRIRLTVDDHGRVTEVRAG